MAESFAKPDSCRRVVYVVLRHVGSLTGLRERQLERWNQRQMAREEAKTGSFPSEFSAPAATFHELQASQRRHASLAKRAAGKSQAKLRQAAVNQFIL